MHREYVAFGLEFGPHVCRNAIFQLDIASRERGLCEARGFHRCLNVLIEVHNVRDELRVRLRLVPSAHDSERNPNLIFFHERGDDGVQRPLVPGDCIGRIFIQAEERPAVVQRKSRAVGDKARPEFVVI